MARALVGSLAVLLAALLHTVESQSAPAERYDFSVWVGGGDWRGSLSGLNFPSGVATDASGDLYVGDTENHRIRRVSRNGAVATIAGDPLAVNPQDYPKGGYADGVGVAARFYRPMGLAFDSTGNLFVVDSSNQRIRKLTPDGTSWVVTTVAGSGIAGHGDGAGLAARFRNPEAIAVDAAGNVYVADYGNEVIRKIAFEGSAAIVSTLAGAPGQSGPADGLGAAARFSGPRGIAADRAGNIFVADARNSSIRKISPEGRVTTIAGAYGSTGTLDGPASSARFSRPTGLAIDGVGNLYVTDPPHGTVRKVTVEGMVATVGWVPGGQGAARAITVDPFGNLYVAEHAEHSVRRGLRAFGPIGILAHPTDARIEWGSGVWLSVVAFGEGPIRYQWYKDGALLAGKTERALELGEAGEYRVTVSNGAAEAISSNAVVTVYYDAPQIAEYSRNQIVGEGDWVSFEAKISGTAPVIEWYKDNVLVQTGPEARYTVARASLSDAGTYTVVASNPAGRAVLSNLVLRVSREKLVEVGAWPGGEMADIVIAGTSAYTADRQGIRVFDLADPLQPKEIGQASAEGAQALAVSGGHLFAASGSHGLRVFDLAERARPREVGRFAGVSNALDIALSGDLALVANGPLGVMILDVSDRAAPRYVSTYAPAGWTTGIEAQGKIAYVGSENALTILDISEPANPRRLGGKALSPQEFTGLAVAGGRVLVTGFFPDESFGSPGMAILDVSDPANPRTQGFVASGNTPTKLAAAGERAILTSDGALRLIDLAEPGAPGQVDRLAGEAFHATALAISDRYVYFSRREALRAAEIQAAPRGAAFSEVQWPEHAGGLARGVKVRGDLAYVAAGAAGLMVLNISDPAKPRLIGHLPVTEFPNRASDEVIDLTENLAVVGTSHGDLRIIDVTNPAQPSVLAELESEGSVVDVRSQGPVACIATWYRLRMISLEQPANPRLLGEYRIDEGVHAVAIAGPHAYVLTGGKELKILEVSNPGNPRLVGRMSLEHHGVGVAVEGQLACITHNIGDMSIVDVSNPASPRVLARTQRNSFRSVTLAESIAYAGNIDGPVHMFDLTNPESPKDAGTFRAIGSVQAIEVSNGRVYVAAGEGGLVIFDRNEPVPERPLGRFDTFTDITSVSLSGSGGIAAGGYGSHVLDFSEGTSPRRIGSLDEGAARAAISNNIAYLAGSGLRLIDVSDADAPRELAAHRTNRYYREVVLSTGAVFLGSDDGVEIVDGRDPSHPRTLGEVGGFEGLGIAVAQDHAFVAAGGLGLQILDVRDRSAPKLVAELPLGYASDAAWQEGLVYVATGGEGLQIIDVSEPATPRRISGFRNSAMPVTTSIAVSGRFAWVGGYIHFGEFSSEGRVQVVDISKPTHPTLLGTYRTGSVSDIAAAGNVGYVAARWAGLIQLTLRIAPELQIRRTGESVEVVWETTEAGYRMQTAPALSGANWADLPGGAPVENRVMLPALKEGNAFFRLRQ